MTTKNQNQPNAAGAPKGEATAHTPTPNPHALPWSYDDDGFIYDADGNIVSDPHSSPNLDIDDRERNAAFIVRACNALAELKSKADEVDSMGQCIGHLKTEKADAIRERDALAERCDALEAVLKLTEPVLELALDRATWREANLPANTTELAHSPEIKFALQNVKRLLSGQPALLAQGGRGAGGGVGNFACCDAGSLGP